MILTLVQVLGALLSLTGVYLLFGLPWTLVAGGVVLLVIATLTELHRYRSSAGPPRAPAVSELAARRSQPRGGG
jgi:hypothetical protein